MQDPSPCPCGAGGLGPFPPLQKRHFPGPGLLSGGRRPGQRRASRAPLSLAESRRKAVPGPPSPQPRPAVPPGGMGRGPPGGRGARGRAMGTYPWRAGPAGALGAPGTLGIRARSARVKLRCPPRACVPPAAPRRPARPPAWRRDGGEPGTAPGCPARPGRDPALPTAI